MKPVEVRFDESTYKEYLKLQKNVLENKKSKKLPPQKNIHLKRLRLLTAINKPF